MRRKQDKLIVGAIVVSLVVNVAMFVRSELTGRRAVEAIEGFNATMSRAQKVVAGVMMRCPKPQDAL